MSFVTELAVDDGIFVGFGLIVERKQVGVVLLSWFIGFKEE